MAPAAGRRRQGRSRAHLQSPALHDAAFEIRDHPAHVMGDDLRSGMAVEQAGEHQTRHRDAGVIGPAEAPPDLVARLLLGRIIRLSGRATGCSQIGKAAPGNLGKHRTETRMIQRAAAHMACRAGSRRALASGAADFGHRAARHRAATRRRESRKTVGWRATQLGEASFSRRHSSTADGPSAISSIGGIGASSRLPVAGETVHLPEPLRRDRRAISARASA